MTWLVEGYGSIRDFFEAGGYVLWGVFAAAVLMWSFIAERLIYFRVDLPQRMDEIRAAWAKRTAKRSALLSITTGSSSSCRGSCNA